MKKWYILKNMQPFFYNSSASGIWLLNNKFHRLLQYRKGCHPAAFFKKRCRTTQRRSEEEVNYTYILKCADGSLYTGWTVDLKRRLEIHNSGKGAKYTRSRRPVTLVYYEMYEERREAMRREYAIKQMSREDKQKLIGQGNRTPV